MTKLFPLFFAATLALTLTSSPRSAEAGVFWGNAGCSYDKLTRVGRCWGSVRQFRRLSHPNAYVRFLTSYSTSGMSRSLGAQYNGVNYGCTVVPWKIDDVTWAQLISNPDLSFSISWGTDFACTLESLGSDSGFIE